jgi:pantetheine-phosphate adenylyltransferase
MKISKSGTQNKKSVAKSPAKKEPSIAIYPGTFDPITLGHLDVIKRAINICDKLIIAVADDTIKSPIFSTKKRAELARADVKKYFPDVNIEVVAFRGLLVSFAKSHKAKIIVRGLRAVSDFEYEFQLATMNSHLDENVQTIFVPASETTQFIASNLVKEVARLKGNISSFVSKNVATELNKYFKN